MANENRFTRGHALALAFIGAVALGGTVFIVTNTKVRLDAIGCTVGKPITDAVVVLADASDPMTAIDSARLGRTLDQARLATPPGGKLIVLALRKGGETAELFARCNPGQGGNELTENVQRINRRYQETFAAPLAGLASQLATEPALETSPLIETFSALTRRPDFDGAIPNRRLFVVSDMLQHSPGVLSHYARGEFRKAFEASALAKGDPADFTGVAVVIDYIARPNQRQIQGVAHRTFWLGYFEKARVGSVAFLGVAAETAKVGGRP